MLKSSDLMDQAYYFVFLWYKKTIFPLFTWWKTQIPHTLVLGFMSIDLSFDLNNKLICYFLFALEFVKKISILLLVKQIIWHILDWLKSFSLIRYVLMQCYCIDNDHYIFQSAVEECLMTIWMLVFLCYYWKGKMVNSFNSLPWKVICPSIIIVRWQLWLNNRTGQ